jgi:hypothetical protein
LVSSVGITCVAMIAAVVLYRPGAERGKVVLEEELPAALTDIMSKVDIEGKKSQLRDLFAASQGQTALHPLANIDPFTHQPVAPDDYETLLRAKATKAAANAASAFAATEMQTAQATARALTGADAGCTHLKENQTDYAGMQTLAVNGKTCMPWADAAARGFDTVYATDLASYPELTENYCRNPDGARLGSWCYMLDATNFGILDDTEGDAWEYCDIGRRCAIDMPTLKPMPSSQGAPAAAPVLASKVAPTLLSKQTPTLTSVQHPSLAHHKAHPRPVLAHVGSKPVLTTVGEAESQVLAALHGAKRSARNAAKGNGSGDASFARGFLAARERRVSPLQHRFANSVFKWSHEMSGAMARKALRGRSWFEMDRGVDHRADPTTDRAMSGPAARVALDQLYPSSPEEGVE